MVTVFGGLLLFVALHRNTFALSVRFPVMEIVDVFGAAMLVMSVDPKYQVIVGDGRALLLTVQLNITVWPSVRSNLSSLGIKDTL